MTAGGTPLTSAVPVPREIIRPKLVSGLELQCKAVKEAHQRRPG